MKTGCLAIATLFIFVVPCMPAEPTASQEQTKRVSLDGNWEAACAEPGAGLGKGYALATKPKGEWAPCAVPGTAQAAMLAAGKIPDPYYGKQNLDNIWMEHKEWWFRKEFTARPKPGARYRLEFDGVDHYATVYLNGKELGRHVGMFEAFAYDLTNLLRGDAPNVICVRVDPPPQVDQAHKELRSQVYYASQAIYSGWAYIHMLTIGIWKPVRLVETRVAEIRHPFIRTLDQGPQSAHLRISGAVDAHSQLAGGKVEIRLAGANCPAAPQFFETGVVSAGFDTTVEVKNPQLWWPNGLGRQNLYDATLSLVNANGTVLDSATVRIGIRTIKTIRNPESRPDWHDWTYVVNDKPFFARGANWIPPVDAMLRPLPDKARHMVWMARQAGMNMFRIWGGGSLETQDFYDLCDEYGILTQQESPLGIPLIEFHVDPEQYRRVVTCQVLETRNHPSFAIYCGGNEWDANQPRNKALVEILRQVTSELDGTRIFRAVSPWGGDSHNWGPGDGGAPYTVYNDDTAPFISEAGNWSTPCYETLASFIPNYELKAWPPTPGSAFAYHQIYNRRSCTETILHYAEEYGAIRNYEELPAQSMLAAARSNSYVIGHVRSDWPRKSGITIWELKDVWPAITTSNIDYYGIPKTGYYFIKRAYAPVALFSRFATDYWKAGSTFSADVHVVSDREDIKGCTVLAEIYDPHLKRLAAREFSAEVKANTSLNVGRFEWQLPPDEEFPFLYVATLNRPDGTTVASEPYWLNLAALNWYEAIERDKITFELGDPDKPNAVRCAGQEIRIESIVPPIGVTQDALAFLVAAAGVKDGERVYFDLDYGRVEKTPVYFPDWCAAGRWAYKQSAAGIQFKRQLDRDKKIVLTPCNLHVVYIETDDSEALRRIKLPGQPGDDRAYVILAAALKRDHQWQNLDISSLYNADVVGREGMKDSGDLLAGTAFDEREWKRTLTVVAPDRPRTRLMDIMPRTTLSGKMEVRKDGASLVHIRNTGGYPAFLAEVHPGKEALAGFIPSDNHFWLAPGAEKTVVIEKSPAAKIALDKPEITLRAWNVLPTHIDIQKRRM